MSRLLFFSVFHFESPWLLKQSWVLTGRYGRTRSQRECCNVIPSAIFLKGEGSSSSSVKFHWGPRLVEGNILRDAWGVLKVQPVVDETLNVVVWGWTGKRTNEWEANSWSKVGVERNLRHETTTASVPIRSYKKTVLGVLTPGASRCLGCWWKAFWRLGI